MVEPRVPLMVDQMVVMMVVRMDDIVADS